MKIKVGDWVKVECLENAVARVTQIDERGISVYIGKLMQNLYTGGFIKYLTKLPIRFNEFEIVLQPAGDQLRWDCARAPRGGHIHFVCVVVDGRFHIGIDPSKGKYICNNFLTLEEARDWLELQYATILAKARNLI